MENATIWYNGDTVDTSDDDGRFHFSVAEELERITMTVDATDGTNLTDTTQTLAVGKTATGVFSITVKLMEKAPAMEMNASEEIVATVNASNSNKSLGDLMIPAKSFYDENGEVYEVRFIVAMVIYFHRHV